MRTKRAAPVAGFLLMLWAESSVFSRLMAASVAGCVAAWADTPVRTAATADATRDRVIRCDM